jgi:hypothetical protein
LDPKSSLRPRTRHKAEAEASTRPQKAGSLKTDAV